MITKEVKQYKRGEKGFTYRIDLSKQDGLKGEEKVYILTEEEYKSKNKELTNTTQQIETMKNEAEKEIKNLNIETQDKIETINTEYQIKINKKEEEIKDHIKTHKVEVNAMKREYNILLTKHEQSLHEYSDSIKDLTKQLNDTVNDKNKYKDTIAGLRILLGKYKNRNIVDRILNKDISLDIDDKKIVTNYQTLELENLEKIKEK